MLINDLVGKSFSLIERIKLKGIGSKRMVIEHTSPHFKDYLNTVSDVNYANLELRPSGVLVRINKGLQTFTWVIPFYQLVVFKVNGSSIHAQGKFIHFKNNSTLKENKPFFEMLLDRKIKLDEQYNFNYN